MGVVLVDNWPPGVNAVDAVVEVLLSFDVVCKTLFVDALNSDFMDEDLFDV